MISNIKDLLGLLPLALHLGKRKKLFSPGCKAQGSSKRDSPEAHGRPYRHFLNLLVSPGRSSLAMSKYFEAEELRPFPEGKAVAGQSPRKPMESKEGHGLWCTRSSTGTSVLPEMPLLQTLAKASGITLPPFHRLTHLSPCSSSQRNTCCKRMEIG